MSQWSEIGYLCFCFPLEVNSVNGIKVSFIKCLLPKKNWVEYTNKFNF